VEIRIVNSCFVRLTSRFVDPGVTTIAVQRYLDDLVRTDSDAPAQPIIRQLLARSVDRLHLLCAPAVPELSAPDPDRGLVLLKQRLGNLAVQSSQNPM
jgi:hypothetical protein